MIRKAYFSSQFAKKFAFRFLLAFAILSASFIQAYAQSYQGYAVKNANLREGPGKQYNIIEPLIAGDTVFIISIETKNDFFNVIHVKTASEGWVHKSLIKIESEVPENSEPVFTPEGKSTSENPEAEIFNNTNLTMTLDINGKKYIFAPKEKKTLTLTAGNCNFRASAPGVIPFSGKDHLERSYLYSWTFYIETVRR